MTPADVGSLADRLRTRLSGKLLRVAAAYTADLKVALSVPVPPDRPRATPGAVPRLDTGRLRTSVSFRIDAESMTARVGSAVRYATYLERAKANPHPFLAPVWAENAERYAAL